MDTHAHLDAAEFEGDRGEMMERARVAGVSLCVLPAVSARHFDAVRELAHQHGHAYALGIHPMATPHVQDEELTLLAVALERHRDDPRLVAVGEIGVDGFDPACTTPQAMSRQQHFYRTQLALAAKHGLPVVLHVRRAVDHVLSGLRAQRQPAVAGGIAHAFNGSKEQAAAFAGLGVRLGFGGAMTFDRALQLRRLAAELPLQSIVLETDAPDIPPHWVYRTREQREAGDVARNEPSELPRIAHSLAALRDTSLASVAAHTMHNACAALPRLSALWLNAGRVLGAA